MNHVFMIIFHDNFFELKKLIEYLSAKNHYFVLGIDKKANSVELQKSILKVAGERAVYLEHKINFFGGGDRFQQHYI